MASTINGTTTSYIGNTFEWTGSASTMVKYYFEGSARLAERQGTGDPQYFLDDHLGSTSLTVDANGNLTAELRYTAWGESRYTNGSTPTTYRFTGQKQEAALGGVEGLYYYGARWYDPYLNRWIQPDSIIPDPNNPQDYDRYSYVRNNPVINMDPTGHDVDCAVTDTECKNQVQIEKADDLLETLIGTLTTWNQLTNAQKNILRKAGWDQSSWDNSDFVKGGVTVINGSSEDPAVYLSLFIAFGINGPSLIASGKEAVAQLAVACFMNPICAQAVFGTPSNYAPRLDNQTDLFHDFPRSLDQIILQYGDRIAKNYDYIIYQLEGSINEDNGMYQIGVTLFNFTQVMVHHFFEPFK